MTQVDSIGTHATTVKTNNRVTTVTYHSTEVVIFDDDAIILDTDGYKTYTTKLRMNQASNEFGLDFTVYQKNYRWFVWLRDTDQELPFDSDMIKFPRNRSGKVVLIGRAGWVIPNTWANPEEADEG